MKAFLDDVSLAGQPEPVLNAFDLLERRANAGGLQVQRDKCEILLPASRNLEQKVKHKLDELQLSVVQGALPMLGTVVGNDPAAVQQWVNKKVESWRSMLPLLERQEIPAQLALLIARWCMVAKPNTLYRQQLPSRLSNYTTTKSSAQLSDVYSSTFRAFPEKSCRRQSKREGLAFPRQRKSLHMRLQQVWLQAWPSWQIATWTTMDLNKFTLCQDFRSWSVFCKRTAIRLSSLKTNLTSSRWTSLRYTTQLNKTAVKNYVHCARGSNGQA